MSNSTRTGRNSSKASTSSSQGQPRLLGWCVLFGGAVSTWCWYRPLPSAMEPRSSISATDAALHSMTSPAQPSALLAPSSGPIDSSIDSAKPSRATIGPLPEDLIGEQEVAMQPFQEDRHRALQERVGREPLPVVPIEGPLSALGRSPQKPPLWTNGEKQDPYRNLAQAERRSESQSIALAPLPAALEPSGDADASPFRSGNPTVAPRDRRTTSESIQSMATSLPTLPTKWPDEDYRPASPGKFEFRADRPTQSLASDDRSREQPSVQPVQRGPKDPSTSRMSLAGSRIRTQDSDPEIKQLPHPGFPTPAVEPQRSIGNVIRQPSPTNAKGGSR
ncbi:MAG: hypothetical protein ACK5OB_20195 [Pirellula sp.]